VAKNHLLMFNNEGDAPIQVAIEPWAMVETLAPGGEINIEVPRRRGVDFSPQVVAESDGAVSIYLTYVAWRSNGVFQMQIPWQARISLPDRVVVFGRESFDRATDDVLRQRRGRV
jgi:hypothetical protein